MQDMFMPEDILDFYSALGFLQLKITQNLPRVQLHKWTHTKHLKSWSRTDGYVSRLETSLRFLRYLADTAGSLNYFLELQPCSYQLPE